MTQRDIPVATQEILERTSSPDAMLAFLTITHSRLQEPIRVVSDVLDYSRDGYTWTGIVFEFKLINDDENAPETRLTVPNVDRRVGQALRESRERAQIKLEICSSADFDLTVNPRTELGGGPAPVIYSFNHYELADVSVDVMQMSGRVMLRDFSKEPWPRIFSTRTRLPGLYR